MAGRYLVSENPTVLCKLIPGVGTTMAVYDMTGNPIALAPGDDACAEIIPGIFVWETNLLPVGAISVTGITKLLFVMTGGGIVVEDVKEWGGYPDLLIGLAQMNVYIDQCVYNASYGGLETARLRIYDQAVNVGTVTGVIATLTLTAVITGRGQFSSWKQVRA